MAKNIRIGVINWDAGLTGDTYFGRYMLNSLSNPKHRARLPYYTKKNTDWYFPERSDEEYDEELKMAIEAGVDFFAYCWYPDGVGKRVIGEEAYPEIAEHLPELNRMRKKYQRSPLNKRIKMCAAIVASHAFSEKDFQELFFAMKQDYYEKKEGRPLLLVFGGYLTKFFATVREKARAEGLNPYIIFLDNGEISKTGDYSEADAVSDYASIHEASTFEEHCAKSQADNEKRRSYGIPVVPLFGVGWNPQPRNDRPVPWVEYEGNTYAPAPNGNQTEKAMKDFFAWINENSTYASTGYGMVYAWNEFEEGGYLCPTLSPDGKPNREVLDGFSRAVK